MRRLLTFLFALSAVVTASQQPAPPPVRPRPAAAQPEVRLVLLIAVDQFRYDYLTRFRKEFTGGFDRLLTQGAVFTDANLEHYPTVTAIGHATMLSGATPSVSGIIGNDWFDRETAAQVQSITDYDASSRSARRMRRRHRHGGCSSARWATR